VQGSALLFNKVLRVYQGEQQPFFVKLALFAELPPVYLLMVRWQMKGYHFNKAQNTDCTKHKLPKAQTCFDSPPLNLPLLPLKRGSRGRIKEGVLPPSRGRWDCFLRPRSESQWQQAVSFEHLNFETSEKVLFLCHRSPPHLYIGVGAKQSHLRSLPLSKGDPLFISPPSQGGD